MKSPIFLLVVLLLSAACGDVAQEQHETEDSRIEFRKDGTLTFVRGEEDILEIDIEIAETDSARERGLMQRTSLPEMSGMLFIFEREEPQGFWMGNTPMGLDIMFVDADSQIVDIDKYNRPFNAETIASDEPAQYVVEVPAGFSDLHGISVSDRVRWERTTGDTPD